MSDRLNMMSWDKEARKEWRKALRELRILCPAQHPVKVRRERMADGDLGECSYDPKRKTFTIRISNEIPYRWAVDYLIHEQAHAITWFLERVDEHGPEWGLAYARCYCQIEGVR